MSEQTIITLQSSQFLSSATVMHSAAQKKDKSLTEYKKELQTDDHVIPLDTAVRK